MRLVGVFVSATAPLVAVERRGRVFFMFFLYSLLMTGVEFLSPRPWWNEPERIFMAHSCRAGVARQYLALNP